MFVCMVEVIFGRIGDVEAQPVSIPGSSGAFIQWLTTSERGSGRYALRRFTIKPGGRIAMHVHRYEETLFILSGRGVVCAGGGRRVVGPGEYVYIGGGVPHSLLNESGGDFEFLCIIPYIDDMRIEVAQGSC